MKRIILLLLIIIPFTVLAYPVGDVDGNGKVDSLDYMKIRKHLIKMSILRDEQLKRADVNSDGSVNSADYNLIRKMLLGIITFKPNPTIKPTPTVTALPTVKPTPVTTITPTPTTLTADSICESVKNNASIDYLSFISLSKKNISDDKYKDDYYAIKAAHECANKYKKPIIITKRDYHIYKRTNKTIDVLTSVDFNGSNIYIHDEKNIVSQDSAIINPIWVLSHDKCDTKSMKFTNLALDNTVSSLSSSNGLYVEVIDSSHTVFIRYGSGGHNANSGHAARDAFRVDKNGKILDPLFWNYNNKTVEVTMCDLPKETLVFKNAKFYTIIANVSKDYTNKHFRRGVQISRSNVTLDNLQHAYVDSNLKRIHSVNYNYYGFYRILNAANVNFQNSKVQAMKNNSTKSDFIYDIAIMRSAKVTFKNVNVYDYDGKDSYFSKSSNQLKDDLWGITGSDEVKNITFEDCVLNRIDAHEFFYNLTVKNCKIGYWAINVGGFGTLKVENTDVYYTNKFINLRGDYGSTWKGTVKITDSALHPVNNDKPSLIAYIFVKENGNIHNYGYDLYLPNVSVKNFKIYSTSTGLNVFGGKNESLSKLKINGNKYKLYYPSKSDISVTNVTNKNGSKVTVSNNLTY